MFFNDRQSSGSGSGLGSLLAYVDGGPGSAQVIKTAIQIGREHSCYVEVLHIVQAVDPTLLAMDASGGMVASTEIYTLMRDDAESPETLAKTAFDQCCTAEEVKAVSPDSPETTTNNAFCIAWHSIPGHSGRDLALRGRLFDLIIMANASEQVGGVDSVQLESALFDSGRPVLVTSDPSMPSPTETDPGSVIIAWDGSREAAHSVDHALPFLSQAGQVYVVSVGAHEPEADIEHLRRYLARHGIEAELCKLPDSDKSIADALVDASLNKHVQLLVMGAYGHSAIGESLFGGVTREMLEAGKIPLLMAH